MKNYKHILSGHYFSGKILLTDKKKLPDPTKIIIKLPAFSVVILRYVLPNQLESIAKLCANKGIHLFITDQYILKEQVNIAGIHFKERDMYKIKNYRSIGIKKLLYSTSCHNLRSALKAQRLGYDFILYTPIFKTSTHKNSDFLGRQRFNLQTRFLKIPIIASGGVNQINIKQLKGLNIKGFAAIDYFKPKRPKEICY